MAIYLYKLIRRKIRENHAKKTVPTTDDSHLVPEVAPSHAASVSAKEDSKQKEETRRRRAHQWKLMLGLALPNFLAAVDVTIVAPAIPLISSHFNHLSGSFNWIVAAYTLTFTTFVPASGQLADIYGRHFALQFEMFWIMVGSILCAAAQSWGMLLLGRALQGLGAAGIMSLSRIILSDGATLAENARNNSILSMISGVSYAVGPVIGGYLADASWRYLFVLPVGVAVLSIVLIYFFMRPELVRGRASAATGESRRLGYINGLRIIDWPGMVMFIFGVGAIILAIQWGGTSYAWDAPATIAPFVVGGVLCIAFFFYEYLLGPGRLIARIFPNQVPMIPSTLFRKKDTSLLMIINFSAGISLVSAFYFISIYWELAEGFSPSQAGIQLLYYTPGLGVGVYSAMFLCNRWPRQTFSPLMWGSIIEGIGLALLTYSISIRNQTLVKVFLGVAGAGTGLRFMPVVLHAAGIWSTRISSMQSLLSFTLPLGQTIGISMMGSVFSNKLNIGLRHIASQNAGLSLPSSGPPNLTDLNNLPSGAKAEVQNFASKAVMWALISVLPFVGLSIIASVLLGNVWIGKGATKAEDGMPGQQAEKGKVMYGFYISAVVTGTVEAHKQDLDINIEQENELKREKVRDVEESGGLSPPEMAHVDGTRM
ncbi:major facilitator superfamily domain-containing protein [Phaeosphaeriaceae sp. PMI808]|nr:major facilitator superfamily domain-containing protein [Phaeosphaeriaceae sp. PMI808]